MMPTATKNHSPRLAKNLDSRGENLCTYVTNLYLQPKDIYIQPKDIYLQPEDITYSRHRGGFVHEQRDIFPLAGKLFYP